MDGVLEPTSRLWNRIFKFFCCILRFRILIFAISSCFISGLRCFRTNFFFWSKRKFRIFLSAFTLPCSFIFRKFIRLFEPFSMLYSIVCCYKSYSLKVWLTPPSPSILLKSASLRVGLIRIGGKESFTLARFFKKNYRSFSTDSYGFSRFNLGKSFGVTGALKSALI